VFVAYFNLCAEVFDLSFDECLRKSLHLLASSYFFSLVWQGDHTGEYSLLEDDARGKAHNQSAVQQYPPPPPIPPGNAHESINC
jgi:hypothetical protein